MKFLQNVFFGMSTKAGAVAYFVTFLAIDAYLYFH
jgi:uncharacterized PurR-regulated membrane protein YhhQ (DUF165 family)